MPIDPATLVSAGASLLGGLFGKNKEKSALRNRYDDVAGIFKAAEEFKFSPFALLGSPAVGPSVVQNTMGSAIADAGLLLADGMSKQKMKALEEERLRLENEKLRGEVNRMILRPKVPVGKPSIGRNYGGRNAVSGNADQVVSGADVSRRSGNSNSGTLPPIATSDFLDPRREVENAPINNTSGVMLVDNPWLGKLRFPTIDGDEPVDLLDLPSMMLAIPQIAWNFARDKAPAYIKANREAVRKDRQRRKPKPRSRGTWPYSGGGFND